MSVRTLNWLKFGSLVSLTFALGLLFAGALDFPGASAQQSVGAPPVAHVSQTSLASQRTAPVSDVVAPLAALSDAFATVVQDVKPSVVFVRAQRTASAPQRRLPPGMEQFFPHFRQQPRFQEGGGSGFIVSTDGYILTNNHVVDDADRVLVQLADRREFTAKVVGTDPNTDIAILKVDSKGLPAARLGDSDAARVGEWVLAVGNPLGDALTFTVTSGIVSARGRDLGNLPGRTRLSIQDFIQTDAAINPGNSGGPLLNVRGEVIGINSAIASETGYNVGYGFAIPINLARHVMDQLLTNGRVERAALGISIQEASANDAAYAGLSDIRGVLVTDFPEDSPARKAGVERGDIILAVDGKPVSYVAQLQQEIGFRRPGEVVKIDVARRGGIRKAISVRLQALNEPVAVASHSEDSAGDDEGTAGTPMVRLGIAVQPLTTAEARELGMPRGATGLVVTDVTPGGPSWQSLRPADASGPPDVILTVEGKQVRTEADLKNALEQPGPGGIVSVEVFTPTGDGGIRRVERIRLADK
jgi:serine protease Do